MPLIHLVKRKNVRFVCGLATHEICIFSLHSMKQMAYSFQNFEYTLYLDMTVSSNVKFYGAQKALAEQTTKALLSLSNLFVKIDHSI